MSLPLDAMASCRFKYAKENYKVSLNYMLEYKQNLENEEIALATLLHSEESFFDTRRFAKFTDAAKDANSKWKQFEATEIPPYYLEKHRETILRTDAAFRRLFDSSKELLQKANEKKDAPFQHYREMNKKGSDHLNTQTIASLDPKAENQ